MFTNIYLKLWWGFTRDINILDWSLSFPPGIFSIIMPRWMHNHFIKNWRRRCNIQHERIHSDKIIQLTYTKMLPSLLQLPSSCFLYKILSQFYYESICLEWVSDNLQAVLKIRNVSATLSRGMKLPAILLPSPSSYCLLHNQSIERWGVGTRNSAFILKASKPRRWQNNVLKTYLPWFRI